MPVRVHPSAAALLLLAAAVAAPPPAPPARAAEPEPSHAYRQGTLTVEHVWARPTAGAQTNGAAYATIANGGDVADTLVEARSPVARVVELHTHLMDAEGVARMRPVPAIALPPRGSVALAPGGFHVMLVDLAGPLREGESFPLTLVFQRAGELTVEVAVERPGAAATGASHAGHGEHAAPAR